jgi:hypothetical protein
VMGGSQVSNLYSSRRESRWLSLEALALGLSYGAGLCLMSVCLLASFRPNSLWVPYWSAFPALRTDTSGILSFFAVAGFLTISKFLRLRRKSFRIATTHRSPGQGVLSTAVLATAETAVILGTGVTIYLSVNEVTHPVTLSMPAMHLSPWPTEGTLRVIALFICAISVSIIRFLRVKRQLAQEHRFTASTASPTGKAGDRFSREPNGRSLGTDAWRSASGPR